MAQSKKLSGADLAAQLGVLPAFSGPQTTASVEAEPARRETPDAAGAGLSSPNAPTQEVSPPALSGSTQSKRPQGGRPSKAGVDGIGEQQATDGQRGGRHLLAVQGAAGRHGRGWAVVNAPALGVALQPAAGSTGSQSRRCGVVDKVQWA